MKSKHILLISTDCYNTPPVGYGGIERIVALVHDYYVEQSYTVDVASTEGSSYHTYSHNELFGLAYENYDFVIVYKYSKDLLTFLNDVQCPVYIILQNNYSDKLKFITELKNCHISVLSEDQQQQYYSHLGIRFPITPNFIDTEKFTITNSQRNMDIVFIGMIGQHKSPLACLNYAIKNNLGIDFYGPLSFIASEKEYEQKFLKELKNYKKARLMGEIGDTEKITLLNKYKYFIFLAGLDKEEWTEPFGIAPMESQACGCTVITHYLRGGHLSFCNKENSISYEGTPMQLDSKKVRESVLDFDYWKVIVNYYPH